ncbi:MAG: reverse transcriptase domain-containing protein [Plesiomonas sp.]
MSEEVSAVLREEIRTLLGKEAIQVVPRERMEEGFYNRYFLLPKKSGGLRPILDLRQLNKHLRCYRFKMLTVRHLLSSLHPREWFTSVDLTDAYFHVTIHPGHRKFLRFSFEGTAYEFRVLPFGLSLAPRIFTKCAEAALEPLRLQGMRVFAYLDDLLLAADSREQTVLQTQTLLSHL